MAESTELENDVIGLTDVELALQEDSEHREKRIQELFSFFDTPHTGSLDRQKIEEGFKNLTVPIQYKYARELIEACDKNHDDHCDFHEFKRYMDCKELELYIIFRKMDLENDGAIYPNDLHRALLDAGINLNEKELLQFVERIDKDNNGTITFNEWRDFLLFFPHEITMSSIYQYWEKECQVDIGEQPVIPVGIQPQSQTWKYFLSGGVAGAVSRTATAPLDRLKVFLQVQTGIHNLHSNSTCVRLPVSSFRGAMASIYEEGGILSFFRGNGINIVKVAPESAIKFYAYEILKKMVVGYWNDGHPSSSPSEIGPLGRLISGGLAGAIAQVSIYPMDLIKTRLQTYTLQNAHTHTHKPTHVPSLHRLAKDILQKEGVFAFYRGMTPSLIGMIPYAGLDLAAYETLKDVSRSVLTNGQDPGPIIQLICGTISGAFGATAVYPLNVVRTRLQAQTHGSAFQYSGMCDVFKRMYRKEGLVGFYKGLVPNLMKVGPAASITYIVYEEMKRQLKIQ